LILPVQYEVNDDVTMIAILSGKGGFPSNPDAVFLNPLLGYLLYSLYKIAPLFPWYGMSLYSIFYLGWVLIVSVMIRTHSRLSLLFALPLLCYFFFFHSSFITFTSASLFVPCGIFLCTVEFFLKNQPPSKNVKTYFTVLAVCFFLSFLLRWDLVLFSLFLCLPVTIFMRYELVKKIAPVLLVLGCVIFLNAGFNYMLSLSNKPYHDFNTLRAAFHDTDRGSIHDLITPHAAQKAGWTYEDYLAFKIPWLIYDNKSFNTQNLRLFLHENDPSHVPGYFFGNVTGRVASSFHNHKDVCILFVMSVISIALYNLRLLFPLEKTYCYKTAFVLGSYGTIIVFLMYHRFEPRIFGPLFVYFLGVSSVLFDTSLPSKNRTRGTLLIQASTLCAVMLLLFSLFIVHHLIMRDSALLDQSVYYRNSIKNAFDVINSSKQHAYPLVIQMYPKVDKGLNVESTHPLKEFRDSPHIRSFPSGWAINSPYYCQALHSLNLKDGHDFLKWIVDRQEVLLMMNVSSLEEMNSILLLWKSYYLRRIFPGQQLKFIPVYDFRGKDGAGLIFLQIRSG